VRVLQAALMSALIATMATSASAQSDHILITETCIAPTSGEFIEIVNPTTTSIILDDYYVTNATDATSGYYYYNLPTGANTGGGSDNDFAARFPAGSFIGPGQAVVISIRPAEEFYATYGQWPDFELFATASNSIPDMDEALPGTINDQGGLNNAFGVAVLFFWDGASDLVADVDYFLYRETTDGVDKTGIWIDGPDAGSDSTQFLPDTPLGSQLYADFLHGAGNSYSRSTLIEVSETTTGGNGITGDDETSEDMNSAFSDLAATPGIAPGGNVPPSITDVSHSPPYPAPGQVVTVSATITDDGTITTAYLARSFNGAAYDSTTMTPVGNVYSADIAAGAEGDSVTYYVHAYDDEGADRVSSTYGYTVSTSPPGVTPISDIQTDSSYVGQQVTVQGVITIGNNLLRDDYTTVYVQDNSGYGIQLFSFDPPDPDVLPRGDLVRVQGTVEEYQGVTEITDLTYETLDSNQSLPDIAILTVQEANDYERYEGTWSQVAGTVQSRNLAGGGWNIVIDDGTGTHTVRIWETTGVDVSDVDEGEDWTFRGVGGVYQSEAQTLLAYQTDMIEGIVTGTGVGAASISPQQVDPLQEDITATLRVWSDSSVALQRVRLRIPDSWTWTGNIADAFASGSGLGSGQLILVDDHTIEATGCDVTTDDTLIIDVSALTAPIFAGDYVFRIKTAYESSTVGLEELPESPVITVLGADRARLFLPNRPFAPDIGETITVGFEAPVHSRLVVRLYDLEGRLATTLYDGEYDPEDATIEWNGRDELRERVPAGIYICHIEATENDTGRRTTDTGPIVVAVPLR
jgi:DNA/RNA endonuclease YhcR with UshA esterase domain